MTEETFGDLPPPEDGFDPLDPANMAPLVVALAADDAQDITGQCFFVWGGSVNVLRPWDAGELFAADGVGRRRAALPASGALPGRRCTRGHGRADGQGRRAVDARWLTFTSPWRRRSRSSGSAITSRSGSRTAGSARASCTNVPPGWREACASSASSREIGSSS